MNLLPGVSQTPISGIINQYAKVTSISGANTLTVDNASNFKSGDTVMIIQMKGATINVTNSSIGDMHNAGGYEFIIIDKVTGTQIQFLPPSFSNTYDVNEAVQVVRVPYYIYAKVTSPITCPAWNGSTGGIIALFVRDTLSLGDNIDASYNGYRGGSRTVSSYSTCKISPTKNFSDTQTDSAGLKGEGFASTTFTYTRGNGSSGNGGGGGNGHGAGGGGGAGGGAVGAVGGVGDLYTGCPTPSDKTLSQGGNGGAVYTNTTFYNKIFMGGGGGSGCGFSSAEVSDGVAGGGIIFVMTYHLRSNNKGLISKGANVTSLSTNNGGGGGGGGGTILLATEKISNTLLVDVLGGKGGNSNTCSSTGGGGGGGLFWHSGASLTNNPTLNVGGGTSGQYGGTSCSATGATTGGTGGKATDLIPVLNGFLFNSLLRKADTICYGYVPKTIIGTVPRGGSGVYFYQWHKKLKSATSWQLIPGETSKDLSPSALTDTTLYRRVVKSVRPIILDTITDISAPYQVNVIPEMKSFNILTPDTIVCYGLPSIKIRAQATTDGDLGSIKSYFWEKSTDGSSAWVNAGGANTAQYYTNPSNTTTYFYRRKVNNNICQKISNAVKVTILPLITNTIQSNQIICSGSTGAQLQSAATVAGGDGTYAFQWQQSSDISNPANWVNAVSTEALNPGALTNTMSYQRLIISGFANTCQSTSNTIQITVLPLLGNNTIQNNQTVCQETAPARFLGTLPTGGDGIYRYQWDISDDNTSWTPITTNTDSIHYKNGVLPTSISKYFRRIVRSGTGDCCVSTSSSIKVTVEPKILNNAIADSQEICYAQIPLPLSQKSGFLSGGNSLFTYNWEQRASNEQAWSNANFINTNATYSIGSLQSTTYYRRRVNSGTCLNVSDSIPVRVLSNLNGNNLIGQHEVCDKLTPSVITGGTMTGGKPGDYRYVWQDSIIGGVWNNISSASAKDYTPYVLLQNTNFRRIVKSGRTDACMNSSAPFTIAINPLPTGVLRNLDTAICRGTNLNFRLTINSGTPPFVVNISNGTTMLTQPGLTNGISNFTSIPSQDGTFHIVSLADNKGCNATSNTGTTKVRLVTVPNAQVETTNQICGDVYQLKAIPSIGQGKWTTTVAASYLPSDSDPNAKVTVQTYGRILFTWKETNEFCSDTANVFITFFEQPVNVKAGDSQTLRYIFTTSLNALVPNAGNGIWTVHNNNIIIDNSQSKNTSASNLQIGPNVFYWTVTNGICPSVTDSVTIFVDDIARYTGFSPNNDGQNDFFVIEGLENSKTKELKIFNRWGSEVYSSANYQNDWTGTNNSGKSLPDDTYYYVLKADDNRVYKGFVMIRR